MLLSPPPSPLLGFSYPVILRYLCITTALPFGEGQHFVQLAGGTNDRTAEKLREIGLIGGDDGPGRLEVRAIFFLSFFISCFCWFVHVAHVLLAVGGWLLAVGCWWYHGAC